MTTQPNPGRRHAGLASLLHEGRGHDRLYDTYAPQLYRYCWTLLGPDGADEAVYETLLSAVQLFDHLEDHSDLRPWLFALARSASQRRGFSPASPYAQLATIPDERPVVEMALRLPPSQRELLELYLRHGLSPSQIARILGLDTDITGELCRAAVRRAADVCTEQAPNDDHGTTGGSLLDHTDVSELLALLEPPDPPEGLRDRVLHGCADPLKAAERQELGVAMAPLGGNGFPLHRDRSEQSGAPGQEPPSGGPETAPAGHGNTGEEPAIPPSDRVTTGDVPVRRRPEHVSELVPASGEKDDRSGKKRASRRRWPVSATSGLVTVGVALALWGIALLTAGAPSGTVPSDPPDPSSPPPAAEGSGDDMAPGLESPPEGTPTTPRNQPSTSAEAPTSDARSPAPSGDAAPGPPISDRRPDDPPSTPEAPEETGGEAPPDERPPEESEGPEDDDVPPASDGTVSQFLEGVRDFLTPDA